MKHLGVHTTSVELIKSDSNGVGIEYKIVFDNWDRGWDYGIGPTVLKTFSAMKFISFPTFHLNGERTGGYIIVELDVPPVLNSVEPKIKRILESHRMTITSVENATMVAEFVPTTHKQIFGFTISSVIFSHLTLLLCKSILK